MYKRNIFAIHSGMLSKSKGQILRIAASLQVLFRLNDDQVTPSATTVHISDDAIRAAVSLAEVCCQQTAHMAGRGNISDEIATFVIGV